MLRFTALQFCALFLFIAMGGNSPLLAQFLTPEETVRIPVPAEVPVAPEVVKPAPPAPPPVVETKPPPSPPPQSAVAPAVENDPYFADFAAYSREKSIILTWHLARGRSIERRIQLYRFTEEPKVIHDIARGTLIAKLSGEINLYEDVPPVKGTYYYAIFVESTRGLEPASFNIARNLVGPVAFQSESIPRPMRSVAETREVSQQEYQRPRFTSEEVRSEDDDDEEETPPAMENHRPKQRGINAVIRSTFFRGDYSGAIRQLRPFLRNSSAKVRAKAMFYTGLSLYRLEKYERARQYFEHPLMKKFYRRNAEFWLNKITENSG